jgi:hypothetical protein
MKPSLARKRERIFGLNCCGRVVPEDGLRGLLGAYCNLSLAASTQCGVEADILK